MKKTYEKGNTGFNHKNKCNSHNYDIGSLAYPLNRVDMVTHGVGADSYYTVDFYNLHEICPLQSTNSFFNFFTAVLHLLCLTLLLPSSALALNHTTATYFLPRALH